MANVNGVDYGFVHGFKNTCEHLFWKSDGVQSFHSIKGCGMGPLLVLVSPCFREL